MTLDSNVRKGNGLIHIVQTSNNRTVATIDVNSPIVTLTGSGGALTSNVVTIDPPVNLNGLTNYYVVMDDGTFIDNSTTPTSGAILLSQNFERVPLSPFTAGTGGRWN